MSDELSDYLDEVSDEETKRIRLVLADLTDHGRGIYMRAYCDGMVYCKKLFQITEPKGL